MYLDATRSVAYLRVIDGQPAQPDRSGADVNAATGIDPADGGADVLTFRVEVRLQLVG